MAKILVTDGMADEGIQTLSSAGHQVDVRKLNQEELIKEINQYDGLVVRSATQVTPDVLEAGAPKLQVVGRAGVGVDNINLEAATQNGVIVMNAPLGNILSAAEHTIGMIFAVVRNIPQAHSKLEQGTWDKKSHIGVELHGKTLGIIGLGKIGKHVANVLQAAGMKVMAFDPFLSAEVAKDLDIESVDLDTLFSKADIITVHTPLTEKTKHMINKDRFKQMKNSARLVNVARGGIIEENDLLEALNNGDIAAAALDVFAEEPLPADSPLIKCPNLIRTPHLGASTEEAQVKVSNDIAVQFNEYFESGRIINSVNVQLKIDPAIDHYLSAAEQLGEIMAQALNEPVEHLEVRARGELGEHDTSALPVAALKGYLSAISDDNVSFVNANIIAKERGISLTHSSTTELKEWKAELVLKAITKNHEYIIGGSIINDQLRILRFNNYRLDLPVGGNLLVMEYTDRPGMVGKYGSILGEHQVNIARMEVSRVDGQGNALVILTLDDPIEESVCEELKEAIKPERIAALSL